MCFKGDPAFYELKKNAERSAVVIQCRYGGDVWKPQC